MILDSITQDCICGNLIKCLKKSKHWYRDSFWQIKQRGQYLLYLTSEENYENLRKNIGIINIYCGNFFDNLKLFDDNYYDLIYVSNIFDSKKYCESIPLYVKLIKEKLREGGFLIVVTQSNLLNNPLKMIKLIEASDMKLQEKEFHRFNIFSSLVGHYSYNFLLFKNNKNIY